jgi:ubiquitin carboxyl-terminal hydrolase L3
MAVALKGDSKAPLAAEPNGYHFISYVMGKNGHLYELEGSSVANGPIDRGEVPTDEDMLGEKTLEAGVRKFVKAAEGNLEFSIVALAPVPED